MEKSRKVSEKRFWEILRANGGLLAMTAKQISEECGTSYTRQAVRDRAMKKPELLADIQNEVVDIAESRLNELMKSADERVALRACEFYLDRKGKHRGYTTKQEFDVTSNGQTVSMPPVVIIANPHHEQEDSEA